MVALQADGRTPPSTGAGWEREHGRATPARRPRLSSMVDIDQSRASSKEFRLGGGNTSWVTGQLLPIDNLLFGALKITSSGFSAIALSLPVSTPSRNVTLK